MSTLSTSGKVSLASVHRASMISVKLVVVLEDASGGFMTSLLSLTIFYSFFGEMTENYFELKTLFCFSACDKWAVKDPYWLLALTFSSGEPEISSSFFVDPEVKVRSFDLRKWSSFIYGENSYMIKS